MNISALRRQLLFKHRYLAALKFEYDAQALEVGQWRDDQVQHYAETKREIEELSARIRDMQEATCK